MHMPRRCVWNIVAIERRFVHVWPQLFCVTQSSHQLRRDTQYTHQQAEELEAAEEESEEEDELKNTKMTN